MLWPSLGGESPTSRRSTLLAAPCRCRGDDADPWMGGGEEDAGPGAEDAGPRDEASREGGAEEAGGSREGGGEETALLLLALLKTSQERWSSGGEDVGAGAEEAAAVLVALAVGPCPWDLDLFLVATRGDG